MKGFRRLWLLSCAYTLLLYWRTLSLPFFWDDVPHFDFATTRTFWQIWSNVSGLPYYRPVLFTFWKAALLALPPAPTTLLHTLNVLLHATNGALVGYLAGKWVASTKGKPNATAIAASIGAAVLFITYPLAVLPVAHTAALFHLVINLVTLLAVLSAFRYLHDHRRVWLAVVFCLVAIAPFVHEAGVMTGVIVASVFLLHPSPTGWARRRWLVAALPLLGAFFVPVWLAVPKSREPLAWVGWESVWQSTSMFAQNPSFPLQFLARPLMNKLGWSDLLAVWVVAVPTLILMAIILIRCGYGRVMLFGLGWIVFTALPSVFLLPFGYVITSPRLLYFPATGAAVLWASVITTIAGHFPTPRWRAVAAVGLTALVVTPPLLFIQKEVALHRLTLTPIHQMATVTRAMPGQRHLVINLMDWVARTQATYALGHEGVEVMSSYVSPNRITAINADAQATWDSAVFTPVRTAMERYYHGLYTLGGEHDWSSLATLLPQYNHVWLMKYADKRIQLVEAGSVMAGEATPPQAYLASFEDKVYLLDANYRVEDQEIVITLSWKYLGPDPQAQVFRHVQNCTGEPADSGDGPLLEGMLLIELLSPGTTVRDVRTISLEQPEACYYVEVGVFRDDGSRLTAIAPDGTRFGNDAVTIR
ncbi:MAG: hypothetical protein AB1791_04290 [Chloroflexota bacterium]